MNKNSYGNTLPGTGNSTSSTSSSTTDAFKDTQKDLPVPKTDGIGTKTDGASSSTASKLGSLGYESSSDYGNPMTSTYDTKKDSAFDARKDVAFDAKKDTKSETPAMPPSMKPTHATPMKSSTMSMEKDEDMKTKTSTKSDKTDGKSELKLDDLVTTGREALGNVSTQIEKRPYVAMAVAAGLAFGVATILGSRLLRWAAVVGGGYAISRLMRGDSLQKVGEDVKKRVESFVGEHVSATA